MKGMQLSLNKTQKLRLERALEQLESLSSKSNSDASVTVADNISVNCEDAILKYAHAHTCEVVISFSFSFYVESWILVNLNSDLLDWRGHGTTELDGHVVATLCGVVERVNKLVYVRALRARFFSFYFFHIIANFQFINFVKLIYFLEIKIYFVL